MAQNPTFRRAYSDTYSMGARARDGYKNHVITFIHTSTGHSVEFPATFQSFTDSHTAEISEAVFANRMDPLITQASTGRDIAFSFEVVNSSIEEARYNEQSINLLLQMMYPKLTSVGEAQANPYITISGMNFLPGQIGKRGVKCIINSIDYNLNVDEGFIAPEPNEVHPVSITISINATTLIPREVLRNYDFPAYIKP